MKTETSIENTIETITETTTQTTNETTIETHNENTPDPPDLKEYEYEIDLDMYEKPPIVTTTFEKIMAFVMWPIAYAYVCFLCGNASEMRIWMAIFSFAFIAFGEAMFWKRKRTAESFIFLGMTIVTTISYVFQIGEVWEHETVAFFIHLFAVYWVLCRSERLAEGKSSHLFVWDGITGFFVMPFSNYLLDIKTIISIFDKSEKKDKKRIAIVAGAIAVGGVLFIAAMSFLKHSDANFDALMSIFDIQFKMEYFWRGVYSIFVAFFLYGLMGGCFRTDRETIDDRAETIRRDLLRLSKVPTLVWVLFIAFFSIFYVVYFALQGSYLLDAFSMILPEKFTFSEYARKGFGDMCAVMIINFALLWVSNRTAEKKNRALKISSAVLTVESIVFAIIAFLKLLMYIQAYGFTPLRLQSVWLVVVLAYACVCILVSLFLEKKTARAWFIGSAVSLGLLTLF